MLAGCGEEEPPPKVGSAEEARAVAEGRLDAELKILHRAFEMPQLALDDLTVGAPLGVYRLREDFDIADLRNSVEARPRAYLVPVLVDGEPVSVMSIDAVAGYEWSDQPEYEYNDAVRALDAVRDELGAGSFVRYLAGFVVVGADSDDRPAVDFFRTEWRGYSVTAEGVEQDRVLAGVKDHRVYTGERAAALLGALAMRSDALRWYQIVMVALGGLALVTGLAALVVGRLRRSRVPRESPSQKQASKQPGGPYVGSAATSSLAMVGFLGTLGASLLIVGNPYLFTIAFEATDAVAPLTVGFSVAAVVGAFAAVMVAYRRPGSASMLALLVVLWGITAALLNPMVDRWVPGGAWACAAVPLLATAIVGRIATRRPRPSSGEGSRPPDRRPAAWLGGSGLLLLLGLLGVVQIQLMPNELSVPYFALVLAWVLVLCGAAMAVDWPLVGVAGAFVGGTLGYCP